MRRKDREKDEAFALAVLENCEYATLATVNPDGTPYCIPISPVLSGKNIYFHCALEGMKLDNIGHNANVCISAVGHTKLVPDKFTTEFESAVAFGKCVLVNNEDEKIHALRLICEKYAKSNLVNFDNAIKRSLSRTGIGRITIDSITGKAKKYPAN